MTIPEKPAAHKTALDIQRRLKALGYDLGQSGSARDGVDGDLGVLSQAAILAALETGKPAPAPAPGSIPPAAKLLDKASEAKLVGVHPDLVKVVRRATEISGVSFRVLEGARTVERQRQLVAKGASQTMRSRHIPAGRPPVAHAVDLGVVVGGTVRWDWPLYSRLSVAVKQAAHDVGVPIEWGGDWKTLKDGPHFQLPWAKYPG